MPKVNGPIRFSKEGASIESDEGEINLANKFRMIATPKST